MKRYLHNNEIISVFCDCSVLPDNPRIGIAYSMVGDSQFTLRSRASTINYLNTNVYAEIKALSFALETIPKLLDKYRTLLRRPKKVHIYSDLNIIETLINGGGKAEIREAVEELKILRDKFIVSMSFDLEIGYMDEERNKNVYYKAAHNAARKVVLSR
jgi:ribonuclease HI